MYDSTQFDTDKVSHGFMSVYEPLFNSISNCEKVLEIGIDAGRSLTMFHTIFPEAVIHGVDIYDKTEYELPNGKVKCHVGDQENRLDLERIVTATGEGLFDLILDDGGHTMKQQQVSLAYLFQYVKPGGYYLVEDLHTSRWSNKWVNPDCIKTTLDMLLEYQQTNTIVSNYMTSEEIEYLENHIDLVEVWSATDDMRRSVTSVIKKKL